MKKAKKVIPGGVNSPVRAFKAVGAKPIFIEKAKGPYGLFWGVERNAYKTNDCASIQGWEFLVVSHFFTVNAKKRCFS